jgi:hypothetical protein
MERKTMDTTLTNQLQTPPGFNKERRDLVRMFLSFVTIMLLSGHPLLACISSASAIVCLKEGTFSSTKNLKWMVLSCVSFGASLFSWILLNGADVVDEDKAYSLKILLWLTAKSMQACWGVTLALFLYSAATASQV